ncbi:MAG: VWA domain-containing protein [Bacteroidota bacterium]
MQFSNPMKGLLTTLCCVLLFACSNNPEDACPDRGGTDFVLTLKEQTTSLPSSVSIFYKVDRPNGEAVPNLRAEDFTIFEKGRNDECEQPISIFESSAQIIQDPQIFIYCTSLILDLSGSVLDTSLDELKSSAKAFVDKVLPPGQSDSYKMGIYWFNGEQDLKELLAPTRDEDVLKAAIDAIDPSISNDNSTNLYGAVVQGTQLAEQGLADFQNNQIISAASIVVFTDGRDQAGIVAKEDALNAVNLANDNIAFFTIGLGGETDTEVLQQIGMDGSVFAVDQNALEATFDQVAGLVYNEANSYYFFTYCSPKRDGSGVNDLKIRLQVGQEAGFLATTFDATGFIAGCD